MSDEYKNAIGPTYGHHANVFENKVRDAFNEKLNTDIPHLTLGLHDDDEDDILYPPESIRVTTSLAHIDGALVRVYVQSDNVPELKDNPFIDVDDSMYDDFTNVVLGMHLYAQCDLSQDTLNEDYLRSRDSSLDMDIDDTE